MPAHQLSMSLLYRIAADAVVTLHVGFVLFVVLGQLAILVGILRKRPWVRNFTFRASHLLAISIVVAESFCGITCPLTTWEQQLRQLAGNETYSGDFIPNLLHDLLFVNAETWVFTMLYAAFGGIVLLTFIFCPPRLPGRAAPTQAVTDSR